MRLKKSPVEERGDFGERGISAQEPGDLRKRTVSGGSWSAISQVLTQGFTFVISMVLARLLGPKAYGLIGMITVFTGFVGLFGGLGLSAAIIQQKQLGARHLDAAFWANMFLCCAVSLMLIAVSPLVARFYHEPRLQPLMTVIALRFILDACILVQCALLTRAMRFRALAGVQISSNVVSGLIGLGMALGGMGVWSLVAQGLATSSVQILVSWRLTGWRPRWRFRFESFKELFGFSGFMLGFDIVNYWTRNLDQVLIGRFVGAHALGIYSEAYSLMLLPLTQVSRVVSNVMFAALASIQDDKARVKRVYLKAIGVIGLITFPMMIGLFAVLDHFVLALLGPKWSATIPILKLFCWVGLIQSILTTVGWIYISQGRTRLRFGMGMIGSVGCIVAFVIGIHWGIMGVAWAYSITTLLYVFPFFTVPARLIGLSLAEAIRFLRPTFLCSMIMGTTVWGLGKALPSSLSHWAYLAAQVPLGILTYFALVTYAKLGTWQELRSVLSETFGTRWKSLSPYLQRLGLIKTIC